MAKEYTATFAGIEIAGCNIREVGFISACNVILDSIASGNSVSQVGNYVIHRVIKGKKNVALGIVNRAKPKGKSNNCTLWLSFSNDGKEFYPCFINREYEQLGSIYEEGKAIARTRKDVLKSLRGVDQ